MIKQILIFSTTILFYFQPSCQEQIRDVNAVLSNQVYKNIAAYNIRYCSFAFNRVSFRTPFYGNSEFFYEDFLADHGFKMEMKISKLDLVYPNEKFHLYEISTNGFNFIQDTGYFSIRHMGPIGTHTYLVGLNENDGQIKFISGQFFKSVISDDFKLDRKDPDTFIPYLEMRSYVIKPIDIEFVKKNHRNMIYSAYSELYNRNVIILVSRKDVEDVAFLVNPNTYYLLTHKLASVD